MVIEPYNKAVAITPSDTVDIYPDARLVAAIYVGGAGNVTVRLQDDTTVLFTAPPVGSILPVACKRVMATGTTATAMVALSRV
jgi:hypothetical protein